MRGIDFVLAGGSVLKKIAKFVYIANENVYLYLTILMCNINVHVLGHLVFKNYVYYMRLYFILTHKIYTILLVTVFLVKCL